MRGILMRMPGDRIIFASLLIVCLSAALVRAAIVGADVLELRVAEADVIVRGRVVAGSGRSGTVIAVEETIKGADVPGRITIDLPRDGSLKLTDDEMVLVFLIRAEHLDQYPWFSRELPLPLREFYPVPGSARYSILQLWFGRAKSYTMDLNVLTTEEDILRATREALKIPVPQPLRRVAIVPPWQSPAATALYSGSSVWVRLPVNARLEELGRQWAAQGQLEAALHALRYFPSERNIEIVRQMLDDRYFSGGGPLHPSVYSIRGQAWKLLTDWGAHVDRPFLLEPDERYRPVRWYVLVAVALLLLAPLAATFLNPGNGLRPSRLGAVRILLCTLGMASVVFALRSRFIVDQLFFDRPHVQLWLTCVDGSLQMMRLSNWPGNPVGSPDSQFQLQDEVFPFIEDLPAPPMQTVPARGLLIAAIPQSPTTEYMWTGMPSAGTSQRWPGMKYDAWMESSRTSAPPMPVQRLQVHFAWIIALLLFEPVRWSLMAIPRTLRRRHRLREGLCLNCGYDLRASPERCPECGCVHDFR